MYSVQGGVYSQTIEVTLQSTGKLFKEGCTIQGGVYCTKRGILYKEECTVEGGIYYTRMAVLY